MTPFSVLDWKQARIYNVKIDAAVLGDRLPEGTQKPLLGPGNRPLQRWH